MRVVFFAVPEGDPTPKSIADGESEEANWFTVAQLERLADSEPGLRGPELLEWARCAAERASAGCASDQDVGVILTQPCEIRDGKSSLAGQQCITPSWLQGFPEDYFCRRK